MAASLDDGDWYLGAPGDAPVQAVLVPEINHGYLGNCGSQDKFIRLYTLLYSILQRKTIAGQGGENRNYIFCRWMSISNDKLQAFANLGLPGLTTISRHPLWCLKFMLCLQNTAIAFTRTFMEQLTPVMTTAEVNTNLQQIFKKPEDDVNDPDSLTITCFMRCISRFIKILRYLGNRTRRLFEIIT